MIRSLAMIAVAGAIISLICLASAASMGFQTVKNGQFFPGNWSFSSDDGDWNGRDYREINWSSPETTKDMKWAGDPEIVINVPAEVTITQSDTPKMVITGPSDAVDKIEIDGGRIGFGDHRRIRFDGRRMDNVRRLKIEISTQNLESVKARIASKVHFVNVKTDELKLDLNTASDADGAIDVNRLDIEINTGADAVLSGRADDVKVKVNTGADANLAALTVKSAEVHANTGGGVSISPTDSLETHVNTGGNVVVYGHPKQVENNSNTGGSVRFNDGQPPAAAASRATNAPATNAPSVSPSPSPSPPKKVKT